MVASFMGMIRFRYVPQGRLGDRRARSVEAELIPILIWSIGAYNRVTPDSLGRSGS